MTVKTLRSIYQLKITLLDIKPPIWRRVQVPSDITLDALHDVLQDAMGWENAHFHQFIFNNQFFSVVIDEMNVGLDKEDETQYRLCQLLEAEKDKMGYEYDFGDGWKHAVVLEKILPYTSDATPRCIKGKRACPPEDCGGAWGYANLLSVLDDSSHEEYKDVLEWMGGKFDSEAFDLENTNRLLAQGACKKMAEDEVVDFVH